jgi:DnaJ-class molecular chaperone
MAQEPKTDKGQRRVCNTCNGTGVITVKKGTKNCTACNGAGYIITGNV